MPTELTPAPFKFAQQFPMALDHPRTFSRMFGQVEHSSGAQRQGMNMALHQYQHQSPYAQHPQPQLQHHPRFQQHNPHPHPQQIYHQSPSYSSHPPPFLGNPSLPLLAPPSIPLFNPMHDLTPNKCLPNGVRTPYTPYAGETYMPSSEKADRMSLDQGGSPLVPVASLRSHIGNQPAGSMAGSMPIPIAPRGSGVASQGWASGSGMGSMAGSYGRVDDGWDGSQGRAHLGHMPDPGSTAGRLGRTPEGLGMGLGLSLGGSAAGSGGWRMAPSSWQNHARLTPGLMPSPLPPVGMAPGPSLQVPGPAGGGNLSRSHSIGKGEHLAGRVRAGSTGEQTRPRRASVMPLKEECAGCGSPKMEGLRRSGSGRSHEGGGGGGGRERRMSVQSQARSPIVNSPLARIAKLTIGDNDGVRRKSGSSRYPMRGDGEDGGGGTGGWY